MVPLEQLDLWAPREVWGQLAPLDLQVPVWLEPPVRLELRDFLVRLAVLESRV